MGRLGMVHPPLRTVLTKEISQKLGPQLKTLSLCCEKTRPWPPCAAKTTGTKKILKASVWVEVVQRSWWRCL